MNKITILGCGTSTGVPILGCLCQVCQSTELRNKRLRTSALIETSSGKKILIDATPDMRTQLLTNKINELHAAIITHDHADHTHGIDDLRPFTFVNKQDMPIYSNEVTAESLKIKFPYIFDREKFFAQKAVLGGGIPLLKQHIICPGPQKILDEDFEFFSLPHGHIHTLAMRHKKLGYIVDCQSIPDEVLKSFRDAKLDILIIDCLRPKPHQTHLHLDLTLKYIQAIAPRTSVFTHMGHEWDYLDLIKQVKERCSGHVNIFPAIDGQRFFYSN